MSEKLIPVAAASLGFGFMRLPKKDNGTFDMNLVKRMVDVFLSEGFTYFDTAYLYPGSEEAIREAVVERFDRDSFKIASKLPISPMEKQEDAQTFFDASLRRSGVSYFDYYLIHAINIMSSQKLERLGTWQFIRGLKDSGLIKHYGFSYHGTPDVLENILASNKDVDTVQLQINYLDWDDEKVQARRCYEVAHAYGIPITVMEPIKGGLLANTPKSVTDILRFADASASTASWALRFVASLDGVTTILSGMNSLEQMFDNIATIKNHRALSQNDYYILDKVIEKYQRIPRIPCTGCRYCVADCPSKIRIPNLIDLYSDYLVYNTIIAGQDLYSVYTLDRGKASDCVQCHICEEHCPQRIEITKIMDYVTKIYE